jgi:HAD superfamily hydrolase (TIGR01662 family)
MLKAVLFDLGDTLIYERVDNDYRLDEMTLQTRPHALEVLELLSHSYKIGLVTDTETSSEASVRKALQKLGIEKFFSAVVTSTDLEVTKPHPEIFLEALRRLEVSPAEAIMVGNDPDRDLHGARQLGIATILYRPTSYYQIGSETEADYYIDSLKEVLGIVRSLNKEQ